MGDFECCRDGQHLLEDERELARLRLLANQLRVARMLSLGDDRGEW